MLQAFRSVAGLYGMECTICGLLWDFTSTGYMLLVSTGVFCIVRKLVCVCVCVRACVRACVRVCVCVCV